MKTRDHASGYILAHVSADTAVFAILHFDSGTYKSGCMHIVLYVSETEMGEGRVVAFVQCKVDLLATASSHRCVHGSANFFTCSSVYTTF